MSLEIALQENTSALKALFALLSANTGKQMNGAEYLATLAQPAAAEVKAESPKPAATQPAAEIKAAKPEAAAASPSEPIDYAKQVKPMLLKVSADKGRDALVTLLAKYGVTKGDKLPADKLGDVLAEVETLLAA
jgi:hypothetical protein